MRQNKLIVCAIVLFVVKMSSFVSPLPAIPKVSSDKLGIESFPKELKDQSYPVGGRQAQSIKDLENGHANNSPSFSWKNLIPNHFGEFFEIFAFIIHRKWHNEIIEAIENIGYEVEDVNEKIDRLLEREERFEMQRYNIFNSMAPIDSSSFPRN